MEHLFDSIISAMKSDCRMCFEQWHCMGMLEIEPNAKLPCDVCTYSKYCITDKFFRYKDPDMCDSLANAHSITTNYWKNPPLSLCPNSKQYILHAISELHHCLYDFSPCKSEIKDEIFNQCLTLLDYIYLIHKFNGISDIDVPQLYKSIKIVYTRDRIHERITEKEFTALIGQTNAIKRKTKKEDIQGITINRNKLRSQLNDNFDLFDRLVNDMEAKEKWTPTDIGRMAILLYICNLLKERKPQTIWIKEFFGCLGRDDAPTSVSTSNYKFNTDKNYWRRYAYLTKNLDSSSKTVHSIDF